MAFNLFPYLRTPNSDTHWYIQTWLLEHEFQKFLENLRSGKVKKKKIPRRELFKLKIIYSKENSNFTKHWTHNMESCDLKNRKCSNFLNARMLKGKLAVILDKVQALNSTIFLPFLR